MTKRFDGALRLADFEALDATDSLAPQREKFVLPKDVIYLDGNSLGPMPSSVPERINQVLFDEWAQGLVRSWNSADWVGAPLRLGQKIAPLIGARDSEVAICDSTSINLFKTLTAAIALRPDRQTVVTEKDNFPSDLYIAQSAGARAQVDVEAIDNLSELDRHLSTGAVAAVVFSHVNYRTGARYDLGDITARVHDAGALMIWDLAHSAGVMPLHLSESGVDFAVGCGYKFLNGGPGAPSFVYVSEKWLGKSLQPLTGWFGHRDPFSFDPTYQPSETIQQWLCGTPAILSYAPLEESLDQLGAIDLQAIREKSIGLTEAFMALVEQRCPHLGLTLITPRDESERGSQVSYTHPDAYALIQALIDRGVIGDFRAPDVMRFGFSPLVVRYIDVWNAVEHLLQVYSDDAWRDPRYLNRSRVT